ncbi:cohesin domain-containing protein [Acidobacteria bacterium AH-259-D05]|nr:cohesin domain-containing protein [Acidobacteria bacterium AH-259-D05]
MKRGIAIRFVVPIFVICLANVAKAQVAQAKPEAPIRLTVGRTEGPPQSEVTVQASLSVDRNVKVASISMNITFPNRLVSFIRAEKTGLIEAVGTEMKAEVETDAEDQDTSVLKLTLSSLEEGGSGKALPEGPIAEIAFIILEEAQPGTDITLKNEAHVVAAEDPLKQIEPVIAEDGAISVIESLIFSCLFYMH